MSGEIKHKESGQYAYEGYARAMNWINRDGGRMPPWKDLYENDRNAWREAAHCAIHYSWITADPKWVHVESHEP